jgi:hypothetical protein
MHRQQRLIAKAKKERHYLQGLNKNHDWSREKKKPKPETSNFLLTISPK